jgi:hypothetical protein
MEFVVNHEMINYICNVILFRVVPVYIFVYVSTPLFLGYNVCLTQSTGKSVAKSTDDDSNFKLIKLLMAGNSAGYCLFEFFMIDLIRDRTSPNFFYFKILGTVLETTFYFKSRGIVTEQYRYSVLFAVVVRFIELYTSLY